MGVQGEAAAYETLKKLSQSRQATEFVTALILNYLAAEAGKKNSAGLQNRNDSAAIKGERNIQVPTKGQEANIFAEAEKSGGTQPENNGYATQAGVQSESKDVGVKSSEVSQEGLAAAMEIFGF